MSEIIPHAILAMSFSFDSNAYFIYLLISSI